MQAQQNGSDGRPSLSILGHFFLITFCLVSKIYANLLKKHLDIKVKNLCLCNQFCVLNSKSKLIVVNEMHENTIFLDQKLNNFVMKST